MQQATEEEGCMILDMKAANLGSPDRLVYEGNLDVSCAPDDMIVSNDVALVIPEEP